MLIAVYGLATVAAVLLTILGIRWFSARRLGVLPTMAITFTPWALLGMVKIRCTFDSYPCGFMSFAFGVTWHVVPAILTVALIAAFAHALGLTEAAKPLAGAWLALVWYTLPISIVHPPIYGGICPDLRIICHDLPQFSMGGLFYWLLPWMIWSLARVVITLATVGRPSGGGAAA